MFKRILALILCFALLSVLLTGCFFKRCVSCGNNATRRYYNSATDKNEAYCTNCSRYCMYCGSYANKHRTGNMGTIVFLCRDCYNAAPIE